MTTLPENYSVFAMHGFLICMIAAAFSVYARESINFKGDVELFGGYESNIYRNTHDMQYPPSAGGQSYDPVTSDAVGGGALKAKATVNINRSNRLTGIIKADYQAYPGNLYANQGEADGEIEYRLVPTPVLAIRLPFRAGYIRKLGIDESADETNLYEYFAIDAGPRLEISPANNIDFDARYQFSWRDYRNVDTVAPLDNIQTEISLHVEPRFGRNLDNSVGLEIAYLFKKYSELGSYDSSGVLHSTPVRSYHYVTLELSYKHDFGVVIWKIAYRPRYRRDPFEGYYTYIENRFSSGVSAKLKSNTTIDFDGAWRYRHYLVHTAAQPGTGQEPDLVMHYFDISASVEQKIAKRLSLFAEYNLLSRNTNTEVIYFHTYRDYADNLIRAGIRFGW